jgi:Ca2+-binding EF-hand superfamily protein
MSIPSGILQRKLTKDFNSIDFDRDGMVSKDDMQRFAENVCQEFNQSSDSEKCRMFQQGCMQWWEKLESALDKDNNQQISLEEYVSGYTNASEAQIQAILDPYVDGLYALIDSDDDQRITKDEFARLERAAGVPEAEIDGVFGRLDVDKTGYLSKGEFSTYIQQFYRSTDEDAPGNSLLGEV